jgi:ATP-dependent DNA helicase RecQ
MKGLRPARILLPASGRPRPADAVEPARARRPATLAPDDAELDQAAQVVFDALRRHRLALAREAAVPPYVIASDRTLRDLARLRPRTLDELTLAHGIGRRKAESYGDGLLRVIATAGASLT